MKDIDSDDTSHYRVITDLTKGSNFGREQKSTDETDFRSRLKPISTHIPELGKNLQYQSGTSFHDMTMSKIESRHSFICSETEQR